jgi:hypothetical protein
MSVVKKSAKLQRRKKRKEKNRKKTDDNESLPIRLSSFFQQGSESE